MRFIYARNQQQVGFSSMKKFEGKEEIYREYCYWCESIGVDHCCYNHITIDEMLDFLQMERISAKEYR